LDALLPKHHQQQPNFVSHPKRKLSEGQRIQARIYQDNSEIWQFGVVIRKLGSRHYQVKLDAGRVLKRHITQLTHIRWPNVTFKRWPDVEMVRWQTVGQPLDIGYFQRIPNTFPTLSQRSIYIQT